MTDERNMTDGDHVLADSSTPLLKSLPLQRASSARSKISGLLSDWWLWEIISAVTCVLALAIIVVILLLYDSSALPDWPFVFTLRHRLSIVSSYVH